MPQKKQNRKNSNIRLLALVMAMVIFIGIVYAFLTAQDTKSNVFTVGNIQIELTEEKLDATYEKTTKITNKNNETEDAHVANDILPGEKIVKDTVLNNTGSNDAYAFIAVSVPTIKVETTELDKDEQEVTTTEAVELFSYEVDSNWTKIAEEINEIPETESVGYNTYYYAYNTILQAKSKNEDPLHPANTTTSCLFAVDEQEYAIDPETANNYITFVDNSDIDYSVLYDASLDSIQLTVDGYACQSRLNNQEIESYEDAWNAIALKDTTLPTI